MLKTIQKIPEITAYPHPRNSIIINKAAKEKTSNETTKVGSKKEAQLIPKRIDRKAIKNVLSTENNDNFFLMKEERLTQR